MANQTGLNKALKAFDTHAQDTLNKIKKLALKKAEMTSTDAKEGVAVDTGNLRASIHVQKVDTNVNFTVTIGSNSEYGLAVHENVNTTGEYKFLERPFKKHFAKIDDDIKKALKDIK